MDVNIRKILEFLSDVPVGTKKDISAEMNEIFPIEKYPINSINVNRFLSELEELTSYKEHATPVRREAPWNFVQFQLALTNKGMMALRAEQDRERQAEVDESSMSVNKSIIAINKVVHTTNERMLEHAEKQEAIMLTQSEFAGQQVTFTQRQADLMDTQVGLVRTQNNLYLTTLLVTGINVLIGVIILIITIRSNSDKELISTQATQLLERDKEIKRLQLLKSDTVHYVLHYPASKNKEKKK